MELDYLLFGSNLALRICSRNMQHRLGYLFAMLVFPRATCEGINTYLSCQRACAYYTSSFGCVALDHCGSRGAIAEQDSDCIHVYDSSEVLDFDCQPDVSWTTTASARNGHHLPEYPTLLSPHWQPSSPPEHQSHRTIHTGNETHTI